MVNGKRSMFWWSKVYGQKANKKGVGYCTFAYPHYQALALPLPKDKQRAAHACIYNTEYGL